MRQPDHRSAALRLWREIRELGPVIHTPEQGRVLGEVLLAAFERHGADMWNAAISRAATIAEREPDSGDDHASWCIAKEIAGKIREAAMAEMRNG